jgi:hypothetical protein
MLQSILSKISNGDFNPICAKNKKKQKKINPYKRHQLTNKDIGFDALTCISTFSPR